MSELDLLARLRSAVFDVDQAVALVKDPETWPPDLQSPTKDDLDMAGYHLREARSHLIALHFLLSQDSHG